jgi:hypothetical protein
MPETIVVKTERNVGVAILLALFLPVFGVLYASVNAFFCLVIVSLIAVVAIVYVPVFTFMYFLLLWPV